MYAYKTNDFEFDFNYTLWFFFFINIFNKKKFTIIKTHFFMWNCDRAQYMSRYQPDLNIRASLDVIFVLIVFKFRGLI